MEGNIEYFHLTTPQQNIWNLQKYYGDTAIANLCGAAFFPERRDGNLLRKAVCQFIWSQNGIRLRFCEGKEPMQYVSEEVDEDIPIMTFDSRQEFDQYAEIFAREPVGLLERQMYRFVVFHLDRESRSGVLVVLSHLISDAWTFGLMANQIDVAYRGLAGETDEALFCGNYADFIQSEEQYLASARHEKDKEYWHEKYPARPEECPVKIRSASMDEVEAKRIARNLPLCLEQGIAAYCGKYQVTEAVLFETALVIYLTRINPDISAVTIGVPVLNRSSVREKEISGMFVSTMPLTVPVSRGMGILELAKQIAKEHMNLFRHQRYPYMDILRWLREKQDFSGNLYDVMISYQNAKTRTAADTKWYSNGCSEVPLVVHIDNRDGKDCHVINVDYQTAVFRDGAAVELLIDRLEYILGQIVEDVKQIRDIRIVPRREYEKVVYEFNDTYVDYPRDKCVHELFMEQAARTPERTALVFEEKKFTYRQLDEMSDSFAGFLRVKGAKHGDRVAVLLKRDERVIIAQLAVLKLGAIFIPIDSRYPQDRVEYIIEESDARILLKNRDNNMRFPVECCVEEWDSASMEKFDSIKVSPEEPCYAIFTSGSTGKPKGCLLTNRGIMNFCTNVNILKYCNQLNNKICISVNTISFDMFILESLLPLSNGYTVVLANEEQSVNREAFKALMVSSHANIIQTTPTRYKIFFDSSQDNSYAEQLDIIVSSGEALPLELLRYFLKNTDAKIFNPMGPSECTIYIVGGEMSSLKRMPQQSDITLGTPIANTQIYILDGDLRPVPMGVPGELCIAGEGVGKGYLNRPELTAERFVPNPFAAEENCHGKTMYRTGDLARFRSNGEIEYLGRMDTQVKIRGLRIELGEIESVMASFPGIALCAAADRRDETGRQYLVEYYTMACTMDTGPGLDEKALRTHLSARLPKYMVPNYFVHLSAMPMTASGKTDRKSLPAPDFSCQTREYIAPATETEEKLCRLLEELLHVERMGVTDDFFEMGGDSLTAIEFLAKANDSGISFALQNIFDYPTVRQLCGHMEAGDEEKIRYEAADFDKYRSLLEENVIDESFVPEKKSLGNVLLTGATGFLGAHVLDRLLQEETGKVYCLVRGGETADGKARLRDILRYYFGDRYEAEFADGLDEEAIEKSGANHMEELDLECTKGSDTGPVAEKAAGVESGPKQSRRIIPIVGDIESDSLARDMPRDVQTVIHTAASVKHYGSYAYFHRVNAEGTEHVINYAKSVGARLLHISTLSVSGNSLAEEFAVYRWSEEKFFGESCLYIGQPLDNVYVHSKFEAERAVFDAMLTGLDAKVIRVGNLTSRASDYRFQPNYSQNAFLTRFKAILEFGLFPDYLMHLYSEFSPIDLTAEGIVRIAQYAGKQTVIHLNSNRPIYFDRFVKVVHELGISMGVVEGTAFYQALRGTLREKGTEYMFEAFRNDMDEQGQLVYDSNIHIENDFTVWFLKKVGFEWNEIDLEYIQGYIKYFRGLGYLKV